MKKNKQRKKLILIFLTIITFFILIFWTVNDKRKISTIESLIKDSSLFTYKIINKPFNYINQVIQTYKDRQNLLKRYREYETKVKHYDSLQAKYEELKLELNQMKKILEINKTLSQESYLNAVVINRNIGVWHNTITVDKGKKNGVREGMPVIVQEGLIGKVIKTTNFSSTIKLLTSNDINNKISVKIKNGENYIMGLLTDYKPKENIFIIEGIDQTIEIESNSKVTTTGLGDHFPSGIIVGKVKKVSLDRFGLSKIIEMESVVNFNQINFVTILKKEEIE